ncbi:MAG: beta-glycosidase [Bacteroidales bacterium]|nr:beta-glycosidase [Bacteroidales bacterium]
MKHIFLTFSILISSFSIFAANAPRRTLVFDYGWQFRLCSDTADVVRELQSLGIAEMPQFAADGTVRTGATRGETEPETEAAAGIGRPDGDIAHGGFAAHRFVPVQLPHDWSIGLPIDPSQGGSAGYLAGGQGLYVKEFALPKSLRADDCVAVRFDAAYHRATVWLNGHRIGHHMYGYTAFEFDLTPYIDRDGMNRIVVHCNTEEKSRWYTGAGLYRHVWLLVTRPQHIRTNGVFVQSEWRDGRWFIACQTDLVGDGCRVEHQILDAEGKAVGRPFDGTWREFPSAAVPQRWTLDVPYLYTMRTRVRDAKNRVVDELLTPFGLRTFSFDADRGFELNGEPMKLRGMCLHQDVGALGVAVPDRVIERRLKRLKEFGCNAIRCSHNPPSPEFLTICDTIGLLVLDEAFDKWKSGYYATFFDSNALRDVTDWVKADRNHPSVIAWSIGNEVQEAWEQPVFAADGTATNPGIARARMLNDTVHRLDSSRPTLVACQQGFQDAFGDVTDLVGYNYLEPRLLADHKRHPQRKMLVTEAFVYYSGLREGIVRDWVERNPWHFVEENDCIAGSFLWAGVDYHGESSPWPAKGWCSCPFDMTLDEKPEAAYFHAAWQPERDFLKLVVRDNCFDKAVGTDHWQYPIMADTWDLPFDDGRTVQVRCYTTCDSVQFFFPMWSNPQLPLKPRVTADYPDRTITIQLPARRGKVLAVGYKNGRPILRDSLVNHGVVSDVKVECDVASLAPLPDDLSDAPTTRAERVNVAHIRLTLVDSLGRRQQMEPHLITADVEGAGKLLSIETGDFRRDGFTGNSLRSYFGSALLRVQSTHDVGEIRVRIAVDGLPEPRYVTIPVVR